MDRITNENLAGIIKRRLEVVIQKGHPDETIHAGIIEGYFFKDGWLNLLLAVESKSKGNATYGDSGGVMIVELNPECEAVVRFVPEPDI